MGQSKQASVEDQESTRAAFAGFGAHVTLAGSSNGALKIIAQTIRNTVPAIIENNQCIQG